MAQANSWQGTITVEYTDLSNPATPGETQVHRFKRNGDKSLVYQGRPNDPKGKETVLGWNGEYSFVVERYADKPSYAQAEVVPGKQSPRVHKELELIRLMSLPAAAIDLHDLIQLSDHPKFKFIAIREEVQSGTRREVLTFELPHDVTEKINGFITLVQGGEVYLDPANHRRLLGGKLRLATREGDGTKEFVVNYKPVKCFTHSGTNGSVSKVQVSRFSFKSPAAASTAAA